MYVLKNLTQTELAYYTAQPTAAKLLDKTRRDADYVPAGDKDTAAVYVAERDAEKATAKNGDSVEISAAGYKLQEEQKTNANKTGKTSLDVTSADGTSKMTVRFDNSATLNKAVKNGFVTVNGAEYLLSDEDKKRLLAKDEEMRKLQEGIAMKNMLLQNAAAAEQQSDAMRKAGQKQSRVMTTATRIMHGKKVSPADEKELMEFDHDLYSLAKSAAMLERTPL